MACNLEVHTVVDTRCPAKAHSHFLCQLATTVLVMHILFFSCQVAIYIRAKMLQKNNIR